MDREQWEAQQRKARSPGRRPADEELRDYLFGDPRVAADLGVIGRLEDKIDRLFRLQYTVGAIALTALGALIVDLIVRH